MDAKVSVLILMKKLPLMFHTIGDSSFGEQIKNNPQSLNQLLRYAEDCEVSCVGGGGGDSLMDDDNDQKTARILQALYSAVCALHWKSKSSNRFSLSMWFKSLRSKKHFIIEMKGFNDEMLKCSSSDYHNRIFVAKNKAPNSVNDSEDVMNCNGQRWGRISGLCEETDVVVCIRQETTNKLLVRLAAQHGFNEGQYTGEIVKQVRVNGDQQDQDRSSVKVIAVIGEGGSGKTTMARSVYNRVDVRRHFTNCAWVLAPDVFKARDVLADIVKQIDQTEFAGVETLFAEDLAWKITKLLDATRFLIALDDANTFEV